MVNTVAYSTWYFHISPVGSYLGRNILWNLRVRISDPWKKSAPRKMFEVLFWPKTSKMITPEGGMRLQMSLFSSQYALLLHKNALFSPRIVLLFSRIVLLFPGIALLFSRSVFLFLKKWPIVFQDCILVFQKCLLFCTMRISFQECFFPADCTFLSCSEQFREIIFALLLFCFLLELFFDQLMMPS